MSYYPIFLEMEDRRCVVIGGGAVGERKVEGLLESGANVTVIAPELTERLQAWARAGRIRHLCRQYRPGDLAGFDMAFAATEDSALNAEIAGDSREQRIWLNAADDPAHCDFILPAVIRRGSLVVAVSTGGASPAAARIIRDEIEKSVTGDFAAFVQIAADTRRELREKSSQASAASWRGALDDDFRRLVGEGKTEEAKRILRQKLGVGS